MGGPAGRRVARATSFCAGVSGTGGVGASETASSLYPPSAADADLVRASAAHAAGAAEAESEMTSARDASHAAGVRASGTAGTALPPAAR